MFRLSTVGALFASSVLADELCLLPVDVMILQDTTGSFVDDMPNVRKAMPGLVDQILVQNPGSWFGAADFKDKPYRDLGEPNDYCFRLGTGLTNDKDKFCASYEKMFASGGGDTPEAMLQALANLATDSSVGWRTLSDSFRQDTHQMDLAHQTGARLIIMSTDANPHDPMDYTLYNGSDPEFPPPADHIPPKSMTPYPNDPSSISPDVQCKSYDYPSMDQVIPLLKAQKINVVFLIPHPNASTMTPYDYEAAKKAVEVWTDMNKKLEQPESFVQYISADSSDLSAVVLKAMAEVSDYICNETTTTVAPTTTPATTTAAPTTTAVPTTTTTTTSSSVSTTPVSSTTAKPTSTSPSQTTTTAAVTTQGPVVTTTWTTTTTTTTPGTCPCPKPCPTPGPCECPCPEVVIKLRHRPQKMHFDISNKEGN